MHSIWTLFFIFAKRNGRKVVTPFRWRRNCVSASALQQGAGKGCIMKPDVMKSVTRTLQPQRRAAVLFCGLLIVAATGGSAIAAGCGFEPQGDGHVSTIIDNRTFRLEDGREVRLAGIQTVATGSAALAALIAGRDVALSGETDAPDRWGGSRRSSLPSDPTPRSTDPTLRSRDPTLRSKLNCWRGARRWFPLISPTRAAPPTSPPRRRQRGKQGGEPGPIRAS
jgi:hypothetical protein